MWYEGLSVIWNFAGCMSLLRLTTSKLRELEQPMHTMQLVTGLKL